MDITINNKQVKITRAGYLYINGKPVLTAYNGMHAPGGKVTPLNIPTIEQCGGDEDVRNAVIGWASKNYRMV